MMTIEELESACDASQMLDFSRHLLDAPELPLQRMFYPFGFPAELRTNSAEILSISEEVWGVYEPRFDTKPILVDVHVLECDSIECPPAPEYRIMQPLLVSVADSNNYCICDLSQHRTQMVISTAALRHKSYLRYFFLESTAGCHIANQHTTPIHAGCVALEGSGVLLCGDSGAGKSTLSYACARSGWTYITDDCSYLLNSGKERIVMGNSHQVRFRPSAGELFPEVSSLEITPRAAGKPSIEMPTRLMHRIVRAETAEIDFIVFLNRRTGGVPQLTRYRTDVARQFMRQVLFGSAESLAVHYEAIERLLTAEVFELRYNDLDWAVERLRALVSEGR
ncbi:hypothetical protein ACPOL_1918 [Acidisarcina polymorpha]|uniref:HPr kinase n=1 Tax=Acidisarcina polymorpha TaxID=2211140 RepID=A0A2Z5FXM2_9BACT|nr:aldolase [Acidisarcina polymorpha]AXC11254.1 hypothetical protein ACPOL_1918 [Acidisarcina polymorpha]